MRFDFEINTPAGAFRELERIGKELEDVGLSETWQAMFCVGLGFALGRLGAEAAVEGRLGDEPLERAHAFMREQLVGAIGQERADMQIVEMVAAMRTVRARIDDGPELRAP